MGWRERVGEGSKREVIYVYIWLIHFIVQWKLAQHCKATIPQLKKEVKYVTLHNGEKTQSDYEYMLTHIPVN